MIASNPLRIHYETGDLESFRHVVGGYLRPFFLQNSISDPNPATLDYCRSGFITFSHINWNNTVTVDAERTGDFYLVHVPLAGGFEDLHSGCVYTDTRAQVVACGRRPGLKISSECRLLVIKIEREQIFKTFEGLTGNSPPSRFRLDEIIDFRTMEGRRFQRALDFTMSEIEIFNNSEQWSGLPKWGEEFLICALLESFRGSETAKSVGQKRGPVPYYVGRAEAYIEANLTNDFSLSDVAEYAGVSLRTLQLAFRKNRRTTLLGFRDELRLQRVFDELVNAEVGSTTVSQVALKYGFQELGRFSRTFRFRFGRLPKDVLNKR